MPSPGNAATSKRVPIPTLASSLRQSTDDLSRDSSLSSLPQSPTKSPLARTGTLTRSGTLSPRGPRSLPSRSGYVPPLPPPTPTSDTHPSIKSPLGADPVAAQRGTEDEERDVATEDKPALPEPAEEAKPTLPSNPSAEEPVVARRPLPIPQVNGVPAVPSRLIGLGAAPKLRSTSGGKRNINDENASPALGSQKRQHPAEHLSPRKRTPSDSPMSRREGDLTPTQAQTPRYPSSLNPGPSRPGSGSSGPSRVITPRSDRRRSSGALTPSRRVSSIASVTSTTSIATVATVCTLTSAIDQCDIVMSDHPDLASAADASREKVSYGHLRIANLRSEMLGSRHELSARTWLFWPSN